MSSRQDRHSALDRSLSVTLSSEEHDGFVVNSFANDDWRTCRDHVRSRLGMTTNRPEKGK
jgi:hypothetical protein